jgi:plasmid stabilization system protein ParE
VTPLEYHPLADRESRAALRWYLRRSGQAARRFDAELDRAETEIAADPNRWPRGPHNTRSFPLKRFPFQVIYRQRPSMIQILAVAHAKRRPGYWKRRLGQP